MLKKELSGQSIIQRLKIESKKSSVEVCKRPDLVLQSEYVTLLGKSKSVYKVCIANCSYDVGWVLDNQSGNCMKCHTTFGLFSWRHHCRQCGHLICIGCGQNSLMIPALRSKASRACGDCYQKSIMSEKISGENNVVSLPSTTDAALFTSFDAHSSHHEVLQDALKSGSKAANDAEVNNVSTTSTSGKQTVSTTLPTIMETTDSPLKLITPVNSQPSTPHTPAVSATKGSAKPKGTNIKNLTPGNSPVNTSDKNTTNTANLTTIPAFSSTPNLSTLAESPSSTGNFNVSVSDDNEEDVAAAEEEQRVSDAMAAEEEEQRLSFLSYENLHHVQFSVDVDMVVRKEKEGASLSEPEDDMLATLNSVTNDIENENSNNDNYENNNDHIDNNTALNRISGKSWLTVYEQELYNQYRNEGYDSTDSNENNELNPQNEPSSHNSSGNNSYSGDIISGGDANSSKSRNSYNNNIYSNNSSAHDLVVPQQETQSSILSAVDDNVNVSAAVSDVPSSTTTNTTITDMTANDHILPAPIADPMSPNSIYTSESLRHSLASVVDSQCETPHLYEQLLNEVLVINSIDNSNNGGDGVCEERINSSGRDTVNSGGIAIDSSDNVNGAIITTSDATVDNILLPVSFQTSESAEISTIASPETAPIVPVAQQVSFASHNTVYNATAVCGDVSASNSATNSPTKTKEEQPNSSNKTPNTPEYIHSLVNKTDISKFGSPVTRQHILRDALKNGSWEASSDTEDTNPATPSTIRTSSHTTYSVQQTPYSRNSDNQQTPYSINSGGEYASNGDSINTPVSTHSNNNISYTDIYSTHSTPLINNSDLINNSVTPGTTRSSNISYSDIYSVNNTPVTIHTPQSTYSNNNVSYHEIYYNNELNTSNSYSISSNVNTPIVTTATAIHIHNNTNSDNNSTNSEVNSDGYIAVATATAINTSANSSNINNSNTHNDSNININCSSSVVAHTVYAVPTTPATPIQAHNVKSIMSAIQHNHNDSQQQNTQHNTQHITQITQNNQNTIANLTPITSRIIMNKAANNGGIWEEDDSVSDSPYSSSGAAGVRDNRMDSSDSNYSTYAFNLLHSFTPQSVTPNVVTSSFNNRVEQVQKELTGNDVFNDILHE